ncbi:MAG: hypothetical protein WBE99_17275 [Xanthobacteraceae bacterium]
MLSRALVPVTIGLTAASAAVIAATAGYNWMSLAITLGTALTAYFVRVHPLWMFAIAAVIGISGLL